MYENQDSQKSLETLLDPLITKAVGLIGRTPLRAVVTRTLLVVDMWLVIILVTVGVF